MRVISISAHWKCSAGWWLERQGQRISTLDLLDGRFVLLTGTDGTAWKDAAAAVALQLGIALSAYRIGADADLLDLENGWQAKMGMLAEGAMLVRPDGFVAWRTSTLTTSPQPRLVQVLSSILCRRQKKKTRKTMKPQSKDS